MGDPGEVVQATSEEVDASIRVCVVEQATLEEDLVAEQRALMTEDHQIEAPIWPQALQAVGQRQQVFPVVDRGLLRVPRRDAEVDMDRAAWMSTSRG